MEHYCKAYVALNTGWTPQVPEPKGLLSFSLDNVISWATVIFLGQPLEKLLSRIFQFLPVPWGLLVTAAQKISYHIMLYLMAGGPGSSGINKPVCGGHLA